MNLINDNDPARQAALNLSQRLGTLAAQRPATASYAAVKRPAELPSQLNSLLTRLRQPSPAQEHARRNLLAGEFMAP